MALLDRGGVSLGYEDRGLGNPPVVLVHGILCDRRYLGPQLTHFAQRHRTVAVDLRGHGESDAPEQEYTIGGFANDLEWMCQQLGLEQPLVVGHSLGGIVALSLAAARPELVSGIVALDSVLVPPPDRAAFMRKFFARLHSEEYVPAIREYFSGLFGPADDPRLRSWIIEEVARVPRHVAISAWQNGFFGFDSAAAASACRSPFLYIDAGTPNVDLEQLGRLCQTLVVGRTVGAGHFLQLEVPEQVNSMIERFLDLAVRGS